MDSRLCWKRLNDYLYSEEWFSQEATWSNMSIIFLVVLWISFCFYLTWMSPVLVFWRQRIRHFIWWKEGSFWCQPKMPTVGRAVDPAGCSMICFMENPSLEKPRDYGWWLAFKYKHSWDVCFGLLSYRQRNYWNISFWGAAQGIFIGCMGFAWGQPAWSFQRVATSKGPSRFTRKTI